MKLTYVLGAGASANSLPLIRNMDSRIGIFIEHLKAFVPMQGDEHDRLDRIYLAIKNHYTIDTYARKLFLKGEHARKELFDLNNFMGAYFIYEQLSKPNNRITNYLYERANDNMLGIQRRELYRSITEPLDYRYDSFFAAVLQNDQNGRIFLPNDINIISWNYDSQLEISYMNFTNSLSLDEAQEELNIFPNPKNESLKESISATIKINGTAGFFSEEKKYSDLFDFKSHNLDETSLAILKEVIFQTRSKYKHTVSFAWNNDDVSTKARIYARDIISHTDILVIVGYSFPYFNRSVDTYIFSALEGRSSKIYIQTTGETFQSIKNRAIGATTMFRNAEPFAELDQFLIPNDFH